MQNHCSALRHYFSQSEAMKNQISCRDGNDQFSVGIVAAQNALGDPADDIIFLLQILCVYFLLLRRPLSSAGKFVASSTCNYSIAKYLRLPAHQSVTATSTKIRSSTRRALLDTGIEIRPQRDRLCCAPHLTVSFTFIGMGYQGNDCAASTSLAAI